jgi:acyl-CoA thioesterase-1
MLDQPVPVAVQLSGMGSGVVTNAVMYHFGSGMAFFTGAALVLVALGLLRIRSHRWLVRSREVAAGIGLVLVTLSACPMPLVAYAILGTLTLLAMAAAHRRQRTPGTVPKALQLTAALAWGAAIGAELPHQWVPQLRPIPHPVLGIIGDSLTAGLGESEAITWPNLLRQKHGLSIADHSAMGATLTSAQRQADAVQDAESLLLLAIGGNDLLGSTDAQEFATALQALLKRTCRPGRTVVMLELPLPPFHNAFGSAQRRLASQYGVPLVPKRMMMQVLCANRATLDSIHLSQAGHEHMARTIWEVLRGAYGQ